MSDSLKPSTVRVCFEYVTAYPYYSVVIVLFLFLASISEAIGILSIVPMLNVLLNDTGINFDNEYLTHFTTYLIETLSLPQIMTITAVGLWLKGMFLIAALFFVGNVYTKVAYNLRADIIDGLVKSKWIFFIRQPIGELSHALGFDVNTASHAFRASMDMLAYTMQAVIYITIAAFMDIKIVLLSLIVGGIGLVFFRFTMQHAKKYAWQYNDILQNLAGQVANIFSNFKPLKAMAADAQVRKVLYEKMDHARLSHRNQIFFVELSKNLQEPLAGTFLIIGLFALISMTHISFGKMVFFIFVFHRIMRAFVNVQNLYIQVLRAAPHYWNLKTLMAKTKASAETHDENGAEPKFEEDFTLHDVSFSYDQETILDRLNLQIKKGQRIVITGPSGAGKSTFLDILTGLLTPTAGYLALDSANTTTLNMARFRETIGFVPQEPFLMHDTIYNNIILGRHNTTAAQVEKALKQAELLDVVGNLDQGWNTIIGEGGLRLSGGQRQRLSLARALVRNPSLLILDEATSALDFETEEKIVHTIQNNLDSDLTIVAVTHRKALLDIADTVYAMEAGRLSESPDHAAHV